jgi:hypothetical protein
MTMRTLFIFLVLTIAGSQLSAQNLICVQSGNNASFYTDIQDAIDNAQNGDYVYVPGGVIPTNNQFGNVTINKAIHLVGAGSHPDSTVATGLSLISGNINIVDGANGGSLSGVQCANIYIGSNSTDHNVHGFSLTRNHFGVLSFWTDDTDTTWAKNVTVQENVLDAIYGGFAHNCLFKNNIIEGRVTGLFSCTFSNNVFLRPNTQTQCYYNQRVFEDVTFSSFSNNVFLWIRDNCAIGSNLSGTFENNLFLSSNPNLGGSVISHNNIYGVDRQDIFVNQTGFEIDFTHDYRLKPTCPGTGAGIDGTDVGIYGGSHPFKEGLVPFNPHIQLRQIDYQTNGLGELPVNIKVAAQDR